MEKIKEFLKYNFKDATSYVVDDHELSINCGVMFRTILRMNEIHPIEYMYINKTYAPNEITIKFYEQPENLHLPKGET